jgi:NADP-dependent 3-hydroxy acid dehydrogenase YdfG
VTETEKLREIADKWGNNIERNVTFLGRNACLTWIVPDFDLAGKLPNIRCWEYTLEVRNKVIVVTGAGSGIGRELTLHLLSKGASVAGIDVNSTALEETSSLAGQWSTKLQGFVVNVADRSAVEALPAQVIAHFGAVDCVVNNAGMIQPFTKLNNLDYSVIERVFNVNLFGRLFMTKAFLPHLLLRPEAHIVNLSSMGGFLAVPGQTIYCAAKAAVKLMSEGLASELLGTNVHVTVVFPGAVATNIRGNSGVQMPNKFESSEAIKAPPA